MDDFPSDTVPTKTFRGRGAGSNPPNRFLPLAVERDAWTLEEDPDPETVLLRDTTRTVLATNDSPDVGFDVSLNPYRGCSQGCAYCLHGDTPILMADGTLRELALLRRGDRIYGTVRKGRYRRYIKTVVLAHWVTRKSAFRITLEDGTTLVASGDHRFLTERGWKYVTGRNHGAARRPHLTTNNALMGVGALGPGCRPSDDYRSGYLCGVIRGDGHLATHDWSRNGRSGRLYQFRLAMTDTIALDRTARFLKRFGVETQPFLFHDGADGRKVIHAIRAQRISTFERIKQLIEWRKEATTEWSAGFLAGLFDAEGSYSQGVLRISNTDEAIVDTTVRSMRRLGFDCTVERQICNRSRPISTVRLRGGLEAHLRFFHRVDPAIKRKRNIAGRALKSQSRLGVLSVEPIGQRMLYDITTGTGDFIANGVVSHNCYARPTHEYLGFSAGLDFETKVLVKAEAPQLLRAELMKKSWRPQPIAFSGVTDAYQPAERRLRITRGCVEVLAEFRNPVVVVTKSHLVTRDVDLLGELAGHHAARVMLSVTTLDPELARKMEPRAATPERRLDAIAKLSEAGIQAGALVGPVIPGLTDHELPTILEAAAAAGAQTASYILLRLPHGVKELFADWLERNFPDRKEKVMSRVREVRSGKLNDPRFRSRMRGEGPYAEHIRSMFEVAKRRHGLDRPIEPLSTEAFRRPAPGGQGDLFA